MSKKSRSRRSFDKQRGKRAQALAKSASQWLYQIHWSLQSQLSWKKSLLLTCKILGLLVNTVAADENYPPLNRDNLTIPIQIQLSQNLDHSNLIILICHWQGNCLVFEKFLLLTYQILGLRVNTLATDEKHAVLTRDKLRILIQMQIPQKQKIFLKFFVAFWNLD